MGKELITAEQLRELVHYNPHTGILTRIKRGRAARLGPIGTKNTPGYLIVSLLGHEYLAHRLAWLYMMGEWPKGQIDHINGIGTDNIFSNLRDVSPRTNYENKKKCSNRSLSGLLGVSKSWKGYKATISTRGKHIYLGTYPTAEEAYEVYLQAKRKLHVGCTI